MPTNLNMSLYRNHAIVVEMMQGFMMDQNPSDRPNYVDTVMEATLDNGAKSQLVQKLYTDIINHAGIDFGRIPDSKGDLSRYYYYPQMEDSIAILNKLFTDASQYPNMTVMNKLHDVLFELRGDFEFGFKFNIEFIKLTYNLLVMGLYEMIEVCICDYTDYLKTVLDIDGPKSKKHAPKARAISKYISSFLKSYENGDWKKIVHQFKTNPSNFFGDAAAGFAAAGAAAKGMGGLGATIAGVVSTPVGLGAAIVLGLIAILGIIRYLTYKFYNSSNKFKEWAHIQSELIRANMQIENSSNMGSIEAQQKMLDHLDGIVSTIDAKIIKEENAVSKKLVRTNKENFSKQELTQTPNYTEFELV